MLVNKNNIIRSLLDVCEVLGLTMWLCETKGSWGYDMGIKIHVYKKRNNFNSNNFLMNVGFDMNLQKCD